MRHWEIQYPDDFVMQGKQPEIVWASRRFLTFKSALRYLRRHPDKALRFNHIKMIQDKDVRTPLYYQSPEGYWVQQGTPNRALDLKSGAHYRIKSQ